jgi:NAD+ kinase
MRVGLVAQRDNHRAVSLACAIADDLQSAGVTVAVDRTTREAFEGGAWPADAASRAPEGIDVEELSGCDLAVSVGGDGTFLFAARGVGSTPIMGVNLGEVGFLNVVPPERAVGAVRAEVDTLRETGRASVRPMHRLRAEGDGWTLPPALNEVVVQGPQRGHGRGLDFEVRVDGSLYTSGRGDGVIVATTTGSTAYTLSEGGPLVHPDVAGFIVSGMCGEPAMPPLVVDTDATVSVRVAGADRAVAISDGRIQRSTTPPAVISLSEAETPVNLAGPPLDFFAALDKLDS